MLRDLIDVRATLVSASVEVPFALQSAIDRMMPMIRSLRHGDGRFALFNGGIEGDDKIVNVALAHTGSTGGALMSAPHSGFHRLAAGRAVIIADVGAPPAPGSDDLAHAGTLSFEMSVGKERVVVNCGGRGHGNGDWRDVLRATAAHSTVVVDETNSSELLAEGGLGRRPSDVIAARREVDGNLLIAASHDGYARTVRARAQAHHLHGARRLGRPRRGRPDRARAAAPSRPDSTFTPTSRRRWPRTRDRCS